jgi:hypothetical protein
VYTVVTFLAGARRRVYVHLLAHHGLLSARGSILGRTGAGRYRMPGSGTAHYQGGLIIGGIP